MTGSTGKVKDVRLDESHLTVWLRDGRIVSVPLRWYPTLTAATVRERAQWKASGAGRGIHWPALDYDLSVEGLLAGRKEHSGAAAFLRSRRIAAQAPGDALSPRKARRALTTA